MLLGFGILQERECVCEKEGALELPPHHLLSSSSSASFYQNPIFSNSATHSRRKERTGVFFFAAQQSARPPFISFTCLWGWTAMMGYHLAWLKRPELSQGIIYCKHARSVKIRGKLRAFSYFFFSFFFFFMA